MRDSALKKEFSEKCSPDKGSKASRKSSSSKSDSKCSDKPTKDKKLCDDDTAAQHTAVEDTAKSVESIKSHKSLKSNEDVKTPRKSSSKEESKSSEKSKDKKLCDDATAAPTAAVEENAKSFESVKSGKSKKNSAEDIKVSWVAKSQDSNEDEKKRKSGESLLDRDPLATLHQNVTMFLVGGKVPQHPTETGIARCEELDHWTEDKKLANALDEMPCAMGHSSNHAHRLPDDNTLVLLSEATHPTQGIRWTNHYRSRNRL
jgi:hypothetical protein